MFTTENTESTESFSSLLCALCVLCGELEPLNRTLIPQEMARSQPDEPGDFHGRGEKTFGPPSVDGRHRVHHEEHEEHEEAGFSFLSFVFFVSFVVKDRSNIRERPPDPTRFS